MTSRLKVWYSGYSLANIGPGLPLPTVLPLRVVTASTSREQLDNLYRDLSSHPMVKMVL